MNRLLFLLAPIILISCASNPPTPVEKVIYVTTPLQLPNRPTLDTWKASDMQCLSTELKQKILNRDRARKAYSEELEVIIRSTQK